MSWNKTFLDSSPAEFILKQVIKLWNFVLLCVFSPYSIFFLFVCCVFVLGCSFFTQHRDKQEMKAWRNENADWNIGRRCLTRLHCVKYTWTYSRGPVTWAPSGSRTASWVINSDICAVETEGRRRGNEESSEKRGKVLETTPRGKRR